MALRGDVLKEIISALVISPIVVADLTDANPNVYWELGVRQSFKHGTVTIAEHGTKLPFDIAAKGTLFYYPKDHLRTAEFRRSFNLALEDCLAHSDRSDSHVLDTVSGRGTVYELVRRDEAIRRVEALIDECVRNGQAFNSIIRVAKKNQKEGTKRTYPTRFLGVSCCELLMTTRYLDQEPAFYKTVNACYVECTAINAQIAIWEHKPVGTEKWILTQEESVIRVIEKLLTGSQATLGQLQARS